MYAENSVTIYHNPLCSKSRGALARLREQGFEPRVIEYLEAPPDAATLTRLLARLGLPARALLRQGEAAYRERQLDDPTLPDSALIEAMVACPQLIERPIVVIGERAVLARPLEKLDALLAR
ncbi:arsenate reductase [Plasticicumulans lactativorans]|uniref:Arsenate reductase n=1 Tax=Plasticicumulans lactativorans TaxID=1133106 RepID=A0A4V2SCX8_9GAMM|nr:arsenate reductase (glutaredoxin) [Plasticicumulans lactativorans]TCO81090.1 arsenate reductase [Plasticicumulans lactativorans]